MKELMMTPIGPARIEGVTSTRYHLNELVLTPAGLARIVGAFHDKTKQVDQAIVCLEAGAKDPLSGAGQLITVDWDQIKRPELGSQPQPWETRVEPVGATVKL